MSVNPLVHLDWLGTVLLPLFGVPFGWAKPVPVEPMNFKVSLRAGVMLVSLAGPASNLGLAALFGVVERTLLEGSRGLSPLMVSVLDFCVSANVALCLFNLLPVGPLDGSRVVEGLVPFEWRARFDRVRLPLAVGLLAVVLATGRTGLEPVQAQVLSWVHPAHRAPPQPVPDTP
jgi:Zn-dependent protease